MSAFFRTRSFLLLFFWNEVLFSVGRICLPFVYRERNVSREIHPADADTKCYINTDLVMELDTFGIFYVEENDLKYFWLTFEMRNISFFFYTRIRKYF